MKYFSFGKLMSYVLSLGVFSIVFGLSAEKTMPNITSSAYYFGVVFIAFYVVFGCFSYKIIDIKNKKHPCVERLGKNGVRIIERPNQPKYIMIFGKSGWNVERFLMLGLTLGFIAYPVGQTFDNHFYPNPYFYWSSIGPIILWLTFYLLFLQLTFIMDAELLWKPEGECACPVAPRKSVEEEGDDVKSCH